MNRAEAASQPRCAWVYRSGCLPDMACDWLERNTDRDFFLRLHYFDPHLPYAPPAEFMPRVHRRRRWDRRSTTVRMCLAGMWAVPPRSASG